MILETQNDYSEDGDTEAIFRGHLDHDDFIFWFAGPSMNSISATVCNEAGAGTDGEVGLHFTTSSNAVSLENDEDYHNRCSTDILDKDGVDDWEQGMTQVWQMDELGDCGNNEQGRYTFRPQKDLRVKVSVNRIVRVCNIGVSFAHPYSNYGNKTQWEWSGSTSQELETGTQ